MKEKTKQALLDIVGRDHFSDSLIDLVSYAYDASDNDHRPEAAVWPTNTDQVSNIVTLANRDPFPITPRGAGTGLTGAAVPARGGLVLDFCRMNRILDIRIPDRLAVVQPGVVYADLQKALETGGFFFPPDPASGKVCTIGGNVATNAGGIRGAKYGVTRDYVMGLEVVLPDGRIMRTGSGCMKTASGYDLTRLFVGSEGTLGVITEITLKVNPKPLAFKTGMAFFKSLSEAGEAVIGIMHSGIIPSVLEVLDENTIKVLREFSDSDLPECGAIILVETDGYTDAETTFQMNRVIEVFQRNRATDIRTADSTDEAEELWRIRKSISSLVSKIKPNNVSEDVTVPLSNVPDLLIGISMIVQHHGLPFVIFGHAGDGNLHPKIMFDRSDPEHVENLKVAVSEIFRLTCELDGTLSGEHGIGIAKAPFMKWEHDPVALGLMRSLKNLLDPNHILNPGKMDLEV